MTRLLPVGLVVAATLVSATPARAQDQGVSFTIGYFAPKGQDSRVTGDVLNADRCINVTFACEPLLFNVGDFGSATISGEYLIGMGKFFEAGFGVGFSQRTVPSIYKLVTYPDGTEIQQDLKLRVIPISGVVRFMPTGRRAGFQPYIGGGVAALKWHYAESGDFVDPRDTTIFSAQYVDDGVAVSPIFLGGFRAPVGSNLLVGGEVRFQRADASLSTDFLGDRLDLGGTTYQATMTWKF